MNETPSSDKSRSKTPPEGLLIRAAEVDDAEGISTIANLPGFRAGTLRLPYQTTDDTRRWLSKAEAQSPRLVAVLDGRIVGNAGLRRFEGRRQHVGSIGMGVHDAYTGRGIGSTLIGALLDCADNWLNIRRVELTVYADNAAAIALYKRFGFIEEGRLKDFAFRAGSYVDALTMARLREQG
ncbi:MULTISPECIES: GNAT family N-acetyltransferase [Rhizobium]|uniref:GNAT family N-acetyltransferase n=1 Tax=Rhizobium rhododendri TaxID=2506430 RepID=A0ABY8IN90_9HYPH|nr:MULTISPECIES: GNAT family N-acetyltransferase [Rhizobium]MBZ5758505.1 GNAT family N-acetyltransferase [Rhizobium sp. VS19-DR96]MBZ5764665.1 GNAT family N-acetyltransferase [Rhizobium sp. VS19-DR129.2]MBZ5772208.1 GNAT family N-acetyltransferase [Rhizobium sp. VS19-DRK62.2]MBZ5783105.1 GNAT family N-acetyltransferase [Rhizobium sp. VS19-DR121]MBZ5800553.1 GNAT family N-acetyltransferase [Rhizobium sp. VS19-DR181]